MSSRGLRIRTRSQSVAVNEVRESVPPTTFVQPTYPHTSIFRSSELVLNIYSPSIKVPRKQHPRKSLAPLPVFGNRDRVCGSVVLDLPSSAQSGHFIISIEGSFLYSSPDIKSVGFSSGPRKHKHVFFSSSVDIGVKPSPEPSGSRSTIREAFSVRIRKGVLLESRPPLHKSRSVEFRGDDAPPKAYPFEFEIPHPTSVGQEMPPTFSSWTIVQGGVRGRGYSEIAEVSYKVAVLWESDDGSGTRTLLEAPILFQPDTEYKSLDRLSQSIDSWLELNLNSDKELPLTCAVTVPSPAIFPRLSVIPYFVVFKTKLPSNSLARAVASTAIITVTLVREVSIDTSLSQQSSSTPSSPSSQTHNKSGSEPPSPATPSSSTRLNMWKRVLKGVAAEPAEADEIDPHASLWTEKVWPPLPEDTSHLLVETRALQNDTSTGFPKRPRHRGAGGSNPLSAESALPDGLYKSKIQLNTNMLPTVDWPGVGIKYFLDVVVVFGQDQLNGQVPLRIY